MCCTVSFLTEIAGQRTLHYQTSEFLEVQPEDIRQWIPTKFSSRFKPKTSHDDQSRTNAGLLEKLQQLFFRSDQLLRRRQVSFQFDNCGIQQLDVFGGKPKKYVRCELPRFVSKPRVEQRAPPSTLNKGHKLPFQGAFGFRIVFHTAWKAKIRELTY